MKIEERNARMMWGIRIDDMIIDRIGAKCYCDANYIKLDCLLLQLYASMFDCPSFLSTVLYT